MKIQPSQAITLRAPAGGPLRVLAGDCHISPAFDPATVPPPQHPPAQKFTAIWDTGATSSVITQSVVTACGLKPTGMVLTHTANGPRNCETFVVNLTLDNGAMFTNVTVTLADLAPDTHVLIGMDIITIGDFSITNLGGNTVMSFRTPSMVSVDYVKQIKLQNVKAKPKFRPGPPKRRR